VRLLLHAHIVIWTVDDPSKLGAAAASELRNPSNALLLGAGTLWEMSIKVGLRKLHLPQPFRHWINQATFLPIIPAMG
jgi:PIN domain nuclease of toxin-antitoxin system